MYRIQNSSRINLNNIIPLVFSIYYIMIISNLAVSHNLSVLLTILIFLPIFLLLVVLRFDILVYLYIFALPLESLLKMEGEGGIILFNLMKPFGVFIFAGWLINISVRRDKLKEVKEVILPVIFAIMGIMSSSWAYYKGELSIEMGIRLLMNVAFFFLIYQRLDNSNKVWNSYKAYTFGTIIAAIVTLHQFIENPYARATIAGQNAGIYPIVIIIGLFFLLYQSIKNQRLYLRVFYFLLFIIVYISGLASGTRSFIYTSLILFPLSVYKLIVVKGLRFNNFFRPIFAIFASILVVTLFFILIQRNELISNRFSLGFKHESVDERMLAIKATYLALEYNPLLGVGLDNYPYLFLDKFGRLRVAHNIFVTSLQELGMIGFIVFITIYGRILRKALKLHRVLDESNKFMFVSIYSFFMISIISLAEPLLYLKSFWLILAQIVSLHIIQKNSKVLTNLSVNHLQPY